MSKLEQLCLHYLETTINLRNVLEALRYTTKLELDLIKNLCLKFIVKDDNYKDIVMSSEFEMLDKPLMVEIVREKQKPSGKLYERPPLDSGVYFKHRLSNNIDGSAPFWRAQHKTFSSPVSCPKRQCESRSFRMFVFVV